MVESLSVPAGAGVRACRWIWVGGLAAASACVQAEQGSSERTTLPAIEVTGRREADRLPGSRTEIRLNVQALPSAVSTIDEQDIARTNIGRDISNVFRRVPGALANNIDQGDTGNGFRMRGFATQGTHGADVAVYVDGMPQNMPSSEAGAGHGPAYLEWLTPEMIGRIHVVKGPVSALFGDQNRAGAVDITTAEPGSASSLAIATIERYGGRRGTLRWATPMGQLNSVFVADAYRADSFRDIARTERDNLMWKLSGRFGTGLYSARINHYRSDFTAAGYLRYDRLVSGQVSPRATEENALPGFGSGERTMLVLNRRPAQDENGMHASLYAERFLRTRGGIAGGRFHNVGSDDRHIVGGRLLQNFVDGDKATLAVGGEFRRDKGDGIRQRHDNHAPTPQYLTHLGLDLLTYGLFAQAQYRPVAAVKLLGGVRWDSFDYDVDNRKLPAASTAYRDGVVTPRIGAVWNATDRLEFYANVAEGFRSPAAQQISPGGSLGPLGASGGAVNSDIGPSKVRSYDIGFSSEPIDGWAVGGVVYRTLNEDEIVLVSPDNWQSVGSTTRQGFELETRWRLRRDLSVYASYAGIRQARIDNAAPNTADRLSVPKHQWKAGIQYQVLVGGGDLTCNADAGLISGTPYFSGTPLAAFEMPVYTRYDFRVGYEQGPWRLTGFLVLQPHRFASEAAYSTAAGLWVSPQPRAHGGVSVAYRF